MQAKVTVLGKRKFMDMVPGGGNAVGVISIKGPDDCTPPNLAEWADTRELVFDDVIQDSADFPVVLFSQDMADDLHGTLMEWVDTKRQIIIHCQAGISRSAAVGAFLRDTFGLMVDFVEIGSDAAKNIRVFNLLRRAHMRAAGVEWAFE